MIRFITRLTDLSYRRRWLFLGVAALVVAGAGIFASKLELRSSFVELLPENLPSVRNLTQLIQRVGGDGTVLVSIEALDGPAGLPAAEAWTARLGPEFQALGPADVRSVLFGMRDTERWYEDHWPYFVPLDELTRTRDALSAEVHRRKAAANPLNLDLGMDAAPEKVPSTGALEKELGPWADASKPLPRAQVRQEFAKYEDGFMVSPDRRSTAILIRPTGTSLGVEGAKAVLARLQSVVDRHAGELARDHVRVGFAGSFPLLVASYDAIVRGIASTALLVVVLESLLLLLYFRAVRPVLALMFAVLVAVVVDFGLTRLAIGYFNTQTGFLGAIVVGNGINYGLVYLGRTRQQRAAGASLPEALADGAIASSRATFLAALASSVAFGALAVASNRGFRHFAFIGGVGMFLCWAATFLLVPAVLGAIDSVWPERMHFVRARERQLPERRPHPWLARLFAAPGATVAVAAALVAAAVVLFAAGVPHVMETNLRHLDNRLTSDADRVLLHDNERANHAMGVSAEGAVALLPSWAAADAYCDVVRDRMRAPAVADLIARCDTLSSVVPRDQGQRLAVLRQITALLSDGLVDSLPKEQAARVRQVRADLRAQGQLSVAAAPQTLTDRFRESDGSLGRVAAVISQPAARLEEGPKLMAFAKAVRGVPVAGAVYDAAGEQIVIADLWVDIFREGPRTTLFSFLGVCALVLVFFREWRRRLEVLAALLSGVALMAGAATLLNLKINFFNFAVYPVTFGIAVDYGANVSARIRDRGGSVLAALAEVGPAVFVCSLTSIVGYFSILFSVNQALQSFGRYAMVGEVTSIATALVVLPALALLWTRSHGAHEARAGGEPAGDDLRQYGDGVDVHT